MQYIPNHLTKDQKHYRKEVVLEQEKEDFQKILDNNGINLHVKRIEPKYNKSQKYRCVTVEFEEKIIWAYEGYNGKIDKRKINKYIELYEVKVPYNVNDYTNPATGIERNRPICTGGLSYRTLDENNKVYSYRDPEVEKVRPILMNRYWLWLHGVDKMLWGVCNLLGESTVYATQYFDQLDLMWLADASWPESTYITTPLEDMIKLFNEHVESGVICDSEYGKIENYVGEHKVFHTLDNTPIEMFNKRIMK